MDLQSEPLSTVFSDVHRRWAPASDRQPFALKAPERPDVELRGLGGSGIDFAVEYWVNGIDDGRSTYASQVLIAVWNALKTAGTGIPYPHRVAELRASRP